MIEIVFRVCGDDFDVNSFLDYSKWEASCYWEKGKIDSVRKSKAQNSGFNFDVFSSKTLSKEVYDLGMSKVINFIKSNAPSFIKLKKSKSAKKCLDIGIIKDKQFSVSANFEGEILKLAIKYDIELIVSFYSR